MQSPGSPCPEDFADPDIGNCPLLGPETCMDKVDSGAVSCVALLVTRVASVDPVGWVVFFLPHCKSVLSVLSV